MIVYIDIWNIMQYIPNLDLFEQPQPQHPSKKIENPEQQRLH